MKEALAVSLSNRRPVSHSTSTLEKRQPFVPSDIPKAMQLTLQWRGRLDHIGVMSRFKENSTHFYPLCFDFVKLDARVELEWLLVSEHHVMFTFQSPFPQNVNRNKTNNQTLF